MPGYWPASIWFFSASPLGPPAMSTNVGSQSSGGVTPFKGQKGEAWEGGYRAPQVVRWPGHIKPGTVKNQLFAASGKVIASARVGGDDSRLGLTA
jgi:hypothetical protein